MTMNSSFTTWEQAVRWLREQPDRQDLVRAAYYDDPLLDAAVRYWKSEEWHAVRALLPSVPARALDVGAGRGIASYALARDGYTVTSLEPDSSALVGAGAIRDLAAASGLSIEVVEDFSERLPFDDMQFDVVFARAVLHHMKDIAMACREFFRVLKPGGRLVAIREHVISRPGDLSDFFDKHPLHNLYGGENALLLREYEEAFRGAGFLLERTLAPLDSVINTAPHTLATMKAEIASRVASRLPGAGIALQALLESRLGWAFARHALRLVDRRPGRLYSFVGRRR